MLEVAFDLPVHRVARGGAGHLGAAELLLERGRRKIADVREHATHGQARVGTFAGHVMSAPEIRVTFDAGPRDGVEGDRHRRLAQAGGEHGDPADLGGIIGAPKERLHAAHRAADDGMEAGDAEVTDHEALGPDDVAQGDLREEAAVGTARAGVGRERTGRALAAAEAVHPDDEEAVGVDGLARTDETIPPARLAVGRRVAARDVVVAAEGVRDEDRVRLVRQQRAVGLVTQGQPGEFAAKLQRERIRGHEILPGDRAEFAEWGRLGRTVGHGLIQPSQTRAGGKWPFVVASS